MRCEHCTLRISLKHDPAPIRLYIGKELHHFCSESCLYFWLGQRPGIAKIMEQSMKGFLKLFHPTEFPAAPRKEGNAD